MGSVQYRVDEPRLVMPVRRFSGEMLRYGRGLVYEVMYLRSWIFPVSWVVWTGTPIET